jgi:hypothetical protein
VGCAHRKAGRANGESESGLRIEELKNENYKLKIFNLHFSICNSDNKARGGRNDGREYQGAYAPRSPGRWRTGGCSLRD